MTLQQDRNFDSLIERFEQKVYDTAKGDWRLTLLKEDLNFLWQQSPALHIWDAGCGFAQISLWFATQGHHVCLCDVSQKMLARAKQLFQAAELPAEFIHAAAQTVAPTLPQFDIVLLHAVLEWLAQPLPTLATLAHQVKPGGYLSLMFYNRNAMIYSNVLKGGWRLQPILANSYLGKGKRLTPPNPQYPHIVLTELEKLGFRIHTHTGIRVFHDYLTSAVQAETDTEELFALEYRYCRQPTYRDMGRYVHVLAQKMPD